MGLLDSLMGNASEVNLEELADELGPILADNEELH
ncbi:MAG: PH domain-containing protein, partial [Shewanella sp.]|nr:PH domain-containing protein [Shewanella sp.]